MIDVSEQDPLSFRLHLFCWKRQPLMSILLNTGHQRSPRQVGFRCDFRSYLDGWRLWCLMSSMSSLTSVTSLLSLSLFSSALSCLSSKYTLYTHNLWHLHHPQYPACLHHGQHHHTIVCSSWWRTEIAAIANPSKKHETVNNNSPVTNVFKKNVCLTTFFLQFFLSKEPIRLLGPYDSYASDPRVILIELRQHPPCRGMERGRSSEVSPASSRCSFLWFFWGWWTFLVGLGTQT